MLDEAKTKGVGFANVRTFASERFGANGWSAVLERLTPPDCSELEGALPVGWYSLALYARLIRALDEVHGDGNLALVVQLGRFEAERDLTTIHRVFLRLANPAYTIEKFGEYWRRFHDSGKWTLTREGESHVTGFLDDWGYIDHALCRELVGYMGRTLELVGAKGVLIEHTKCRGRGDDRCFFRARWGNARAVSVPSPERPSDCLGRPISSAPAAARREDPGPTPQQAFAASVGILDRVGPRRDVETERRSGDRATDPSLDRSARRRDSKP